MATSGSTNFTINRDELIKASLRLCGVGLEGETPSAETVTNASQALNMMVKAWQADGLQLWKQKRATLFFVKDTVEYNLGSTGGNASLTSDVVITEMRVAGVATDTILEVDSTTNMTAADNIGIVLDDGTIQWTTISSITDSDTLVIAAAGGLTSAAAIDNEVYTYSSKIPRPLRITDAYIRDSSGNDTEIQMIARDTYNLLGSKTSTGRPVDGYYDPQLTNGILSLFPAPNDVTDSFEFVAHFPIEDFDATADNPDFPQEWFESVKFGLAARLAPEYGVPRPRHHDLIQMAATFKERVMGFDVEDTSIFLRPDPRRGRPL